MDNRKKLSLGLFLLFLLIVAGFFVKRYLIAPEIDLKKIEVSILSGEKMTLDELGDKVIVLNFWATWCPPCIQEMPMFDNLYHSMKGQNVEFVLASDEELSKINAFANKHELKIPLYQFTQKMQEHGVYTIPATFIFDKKGKLVEKKLGVFESADELQLLIQPYLN